MVVPVKLAMHLQGQGILSSALRTSSTPLLCLPMPLMSCSDQIPMWLRNAQIHDRRLLEREEWQQRSQNHIQPCDFQIWSPCYRGTGASTRRKTGCDSCRLDGADAKRSSCQWPNHQSSCWSIASSVGGSAICLIVDPADLPAISPADGVPPILPLNLRPSLWPIFPLLVMLPA